MKIVLKNADFSQSGIPVPHDVVLDGSKYWNVFTGLIEANSNVQRGADVSYIPIVNNKITNDSAFAIFYNVLFFNATGDYLGCISTAVLASGANVRIDQASSYKKVSGGALVDMTAQEVAQMLAAAATWTLGIQTDSASHLIETVAVSLDMV